MLEAYDLEVDESTLTGESLTVGKATASLDPQTILAERVNMAYLGTIAMRGRGTMVVTSTGMATEVGKIAQEVQSAEEGPTKFQREVATLGKRLTLIIGALIALIAVLLLTVGGFTLLETFVAAVALAVAAIPEGLPVVLTLALAFGTRRMLERHALVRSLPVVEIVGSAEIICTDKTGTITEGRMTLRYLYWEGRVLEVTGAAMAAEGQFLDGEKGTDQQANQALIVAGLCNNAQPSGSQEFSGDSTEVALLVGAQKARVPLTAFSRLDEVPFSSERRMMSVVVERGGLRTLLTKGAVEVVLDRCTRLHTSGGSIPLTDERRRDLLQVNAELAGKGLRLLALASLDNPAADRKSMEQGLEFLGIAGISDPPREEVKVAIQAARQAGIRVVMITGDNILTARAIGKDVGLEGDSMEGRELEGLSDSELAQVAQRVAIYARAEPTHKLRVLRALRSREQVIIMTGDGVNDAPALKGADVGIAMGLRGTDVARDASAMVLLDDNFATIVAAVEEGRRVYANLKRFVTYLLIGNLSEVTVVLVGSLFGYLPVSAVQLLWINMVTDSGPAIALGVDPAPPGIMRQPPYRGGIMGKTMLLLILSIGMVVSAIILVVFAIGLRVFDEPTAHTMAFTSFVVFEYLKIAVLRRQARMPLLNNRWLIVTLLGSLVLQLVIIYSPANQLFGAVPLGLAEWGILLAGGLVSFVAATLLTNIVIRRVGPL
ncbi:MAG: cation-translocating P-type ATPase [Dehalococcoidia bacterium]|nr:cation-translocating P-type ATPase [Dehalococcoidia bacterium]